MKKIFLLIVYFTFSLSAFSQVDFLDSLAFNQKYKELMIFNCDTPPTCSLCKIKNNEIIKNAVINKDLFTKVDSEFYEKIMTDIVIVNEDHLFPQNRIFIHSVINQLLKDTNYYYFFEALKKDIYYKYSDSISIGKAYGFYLQEPQMAENIRLILKNNKNVYSYESTLDKLDFKKYTSLSLENKVNQEFYKCFIKRTKENGILYPGMCIRDMNQFINFYKKYKDIKAKNPKAKFAIFCGHGHISENQEISLTEIVWFNFAYLLKNYLKIDPTTIELTHLTDKCEFEKNRFYDIIRNNINDSLFYYTTIDSLIKYKTNTYIQEGNDADFIISSPRIEYKNNRESWLSFDGKKEIFVDKKYFNTISRKGIVLKAFYKNENPKLSAPADILYIDKKKQNNFLLYSGDYNIYLNQKLIYSIKVK